ncbi:LPXTG cell wall anchor domain-containing protein [Micromonospora profundi]|uniref:LPXTG cell wall anchor domain-containing protein n=1 Tax=Micromonospora profundi TaxID=1420889 RepID=UPI003655D936
MSATATNWLVGGVLAASVGVALAAPPTFHATATAGSIATSGSILAAASAVAGVRAEPSAGDGVTFEIVPATPTPTPTPRPPTPTPTPTPDPPTPTRSPDPLPVTGSGGSVPLLVGLGVTLLFLGVLAARRQRRN